MPPLAPRWPAAEHSPLVPLPPGVQELSGRLPGTNVDVADCTPPFGSSLRSLGYFASNPQVILTPEQIVLSFGMAEIDKLQNLQTHHHYHSVSVHHWSISDDGGYNWVPTDGPPSVGRIIDASYGQPLQDGNMVTMTFMRSHVLCYALIQKGQVGSMPYSNHLSSVHAVSLTDGGPYPSFKFHTMDRTRRCAAGCWIRLQLVHRRTRNTRGLRLPAQ